MNVYIIQGPSTVPQFNLSPLPPTPFYHGIPITIFCFQSLAKGANPLGAPLSFGGFGSKAGTTPATDGAPPLGSSTDSVGNPLSLGLTSASFGTVSTSSSSSAGGGDGGVVAKAAGPVVSFAAPAGSGGGFKSFVSVASDASKGRLWGSSPKGKGAEAGAAAGEKIGSKVCVFVFCVFCI